MKWLYPIQKKLPVSFMLLVIALLIFINNIYERSNSRQINKLVTSIYDDRLVVENYILNLSENIYRIEEVIYAEQDDEAKKGALNNLMTEIESINTRYKQTVLTQEEEVYFRQFSDLCHNIHRQIENGNFYEIQLAADNSIQLLRTLSAIQVKEAQLMVSHTNKICRSYQISSQLEIAIIIVVLSIVLALIFTSTVSNRVINQRYRLN